MALATLQNFEAVSAMFDVFCPSDASSSLAQDEYANYMVTEVMRHLPPHLLHIRLLEIGASFLTDLRDCVRKGCPESSCVGHKDGRRHVQVWLTLTSDKGAVCQLRDALVSNFPREYAQYKLKKHKSPVELVMASLELACKRLDAISAIDSS